MPHRMDYLSVHDVQEIASSIEERQQRWPDESITMAVGIVLMSYGDRFVHIKCIAGEWEGVKGSLPRIPGLPKCPNGHPLIETSTAPRLALITEE